MTRRTAAYALGIALSLAIPGLACPSLAWSAAPQPGGAFEVSFVNQKEPAGILLQDGRRFGRRIGPDGAFPGNRSGKPLTIESQRHTYEVVAAGVLSSGPDRATLIDEGLRAIEWGLSQAGPDGSFPAERGGPAAGVNTLFPKAMFLETAARSLLLVNQANLDGRTMARSASAARGLQKSARWMANSPDLQQFFANVRTTNQLVFAATALAEVGKLTSDDALMRRSEMLMQDILMRQTPDGVFPEKGGFDTNYQTVSLELVARYAELIPASPWRQTVLSALRKGTDRFLATVDSSGTVDTAGNTRTVACGPARRGAAANGSDADSLPLRLFYISDVLQNDLRVAAAARLTLASGQGFKHIEKCDGAGGGRARGKF